MTTCWSCGEAPGADAFCERCGKVQPPRGEDAFAILGLPRTFAIDDQDLEQRYRDLQKKLHPDKFAAKSREERRASLERATSANEAYRVLRDPVRRAEALLRLAGVVLPTTDGGANAASRAVDPELLMEMLDAREALDHAKRAGDSARVEALAKGIRAQRDETLAQIGSAIDAGAGDTAVPLVYKLRYFARFLDEVTAIEETL